MGANDVAAVIHASGRTDASQDFTNDPPLLHAAVDRFMGDKLRSMTMEKLDDYNRQRSRAPQGDRATADQQRPSRRATGSTSSAATRRAARSARCAAWPTSCRPSAVVARRCSSSARASTIRFYDVFEARDASTIVMETRDAISAAARANVNFFTIDPRGLHNMGDEIMELEAGARDQNLRLNAQGLQDERRLAADSLRTLAEETGGIAVSRRTISAPRSSASSARTAATTCSATIRRATSATAASTASR